MRSLHPIGRPTLLTLLAASTLISGSAWAQSQEETDRRSQVDEDGDEDGDDNDADDTGNNDDDDTGNDADADNDDDDDDDNDNVDGRGDADDEGTRELRVDDRSEARPAPPGGSALDRDGDLREMQDPEVVKSAGMGSDVAYATRGVVELGGSVGLDIREELIDFTSAPSVGYFIVDRFELSLIPVLTVQNVGDPDSDAEETNVRLAVLLEPSYHLPLSDVFYAFAGVGLGLTYEEGPGVDFLLRPVVGLDIMIGRSGILKPSGFMDVGVGDGAIGGGFLAGYTVMF